MTRATKIQLQDAIIDAMEKASSDAFEKSGVHIRRMPEYFLNVIIANELSNKFPTLGYRLEMPVKEALNGFGLSQYLSPQELRINGKFYIAIISIGSRKLRHIIEVKRSLSKRQLLKESKRLKALAAEGHQSKRLETGYIAAISRLGSTARSYDVDQLLDTRLEFLVEQLGDAVNVSCRYKVMDAGAYGFDSSTSLLLVVFRIKKAIKKPVLC
ncbi:hypothetical protein M2404_003518 [Rheinheimera pacifica]|uniref:hypothetical protein n=1 Tax=Rheinheimera pacifica TaxID=173990 RepID=UPI0021673B56|nr:hypothetical protein [Rheinheimera pacifica]MCS4309155.1 hypothetical protein [Rheinheimera pacifica]